MRQKECLDARDYRYDTLSLQVACISSLKEETCNKSLSTRSEARIGTSKSKQSASKSMVVLTAGETISRNGSRQCLMSSGLDVKLVSEMIAFTISNTIRLQDSCPGSIAPLALFALKTPSSSFLASFGYFLTRKSIALVLSLRNDKHE